MIRVAAYCRVSTDKEDQTNSFEAQQRYFRESITRHPGWELYDIYADEGITGTSTQKRTEFRRMIADAYAGRFTLILTKEISRFSRNILDTIAYTRELKGIGVGIRFLTENLNTLDPESEMLLTFMGVLAQEESRRTSVRVKWGQTRQMERGVVFGRSLLGYDLRNGQLHVNEEEAELVRLIFRKYALEHKGTTVIARELREAGYRTRSGSSDWNSSYIIKLLHNEKYVGDLVQKKTITPDYLTHRKKPNRGEEEQIILRSHHAPIVSRQLWDAAQGELSKRNTHTGPGHSAQHLFSGKIRCGECGAVFLARQKRMKNGTLLRRWSCSTVVTKGAACCPVGKLLRDDDARHMLKTALLSLPLDREGIAEEVLKRIPAGEREEPDRLTRQLEGLRRRKTACLDSYFSGDITKEEMQTAKDRYDSRIRELEQRITDSLETDRSSDELRPALMDLLRFETESDTLLRAVLDRVTVFRDRHVELRLRGLPQIFRFEEK